VIEDFKFDTLLNFEPIMERFQKRSGGINLGDLVTARADETAVEIDLIKPIVETGEG